MMGEHQSRLASDARSSTRDYRNLAIEQLHLIARPVANESYVSTNHTLAHQPFKKTATPTN